MEFVKVFKTKDGKLIDNREEAEKHELMLDIRGIIQSNVRGQSFTASEVAGIFVKDVDKLFATLQGYRNRMASLKGAATKQKMKTP